MSYSAPALIANTSFQFKGKGALIVPLVPNNRFALGLLPPVSEKSSVLKAFFQFIHSTSAETVHLSVAFTDAPIEIDCGSFNLAFVS